MKHRNYKYLMRRQVRKAATTLADASGEEK